MTPAAKAAVPQVRRLLQLALNSSDHEARAAFALARRLMARHGLAPDDVVPVELADLLAPLPAAWVARRPTLRALAGGAR